MDFRDLKLFIHLADTLHFGQTSRAGHVSPSTLSRVVQRLEEEAGCTLFERDRRHVRLTVAGGRFRVYAAEALTNWQRMKADLEQGAETLRGEISLYCSVTASYSILPDILTAFRPRHPEVQIKLITGDAASALDRVQDGSVDITVAALPERIPGNLESRVVTHTPLLFIGPSREGPVKEQLQGRVDWGEVPMIFPESGLIRTHLRDWFRKKKVRPQVYGRVSGHEAIISMVSLGFGVGVIPELVLEKSMIKTDVQVLDVRPALPDFCVGFCAKKHMLQSPVIRAFWHTLDDV
ncbi:MAG: HTH-type transcriptional activator IlvY [bacterium]|nr:HTH-type transcriptional activator IlvY [bacterium]